MYSLLNILQCHSKVVFEAFCKVDVKGVSIQADGFWRAENSEAFLDLLSCIFHIVGISKAAIHGNKLCELKLWKCLITGANMPTLAPISFTWSAWLPTTIMCACFALQIGALVLDEGQPTIRWNQ